MHQLLFREYLEACVKNALQSVLSNGFEGNEERLLRLSGHPDFGDYFTTAPHQLARARGLDSHAIAAAVAAALSRFAGIAKAEASGVGFTNVFVDSRAVSGGLAILHSWIVERNIEAKAFPVSRRSLFERACPDPKLRIAYHVFEKLEFACRELGLDRPQPVDIHELHWLKEPEEFTVALQLHEFPLWAEAHSAAGHIYRLAVAVRDGFFWRDRVADYWIADPERPEAVPARRNLLWLVTQILGWSLARVTR